MLPTDRASSGRLNEFENSFQTLDKKEKKLNDNLSKIFKEWEFVNYPNSFDKGFSRKIIGDFKFKWDQDTRLLAIATKTGLKFKVALTVCNEGLNIDCNYHICPRNYRVFTKQNVELLDNLLREKPNEFFEKIISMIKEKYPMNFV